MRKILVFIDWFLPAYKAGGQIPSVANIVRLLDREAEFSIVTSDRDEGDTEAFGDIDFDCWQNKFGFRVYYISQKKMSYTRLKQLIQSEEFDTIYFNSFFSFFFTIIPLYLVKRFRPGARIILAPRGMLGDGALAIKASKKKLFIKTSKTFGLYKQIIWHASSRHEAQEIRRVFGDDIQVEVAMDMTLLPKDGSPAKRDKQKGHLRLFFLSRISAKKNLLDALRHLSGCTQGSIQFDIIGPVSDAVYWSKCQQLIKNLPPNITVNYLGGVPSYKLPEYLVNYHALFLPTKNENYGHVIAEALSCGCCLIISDQTPWKEIENQQVGWTIPLKKTQAYQEAITHCLNLSQEDFDALSARAFAYARQKLLDPKVIRANRHLFLNA